MLQDFELMKQVPESSHQIVFFWLEPIRVAEVGSLSSGAKMVIKTFKWRASKATKLNTLDSASLQHIDSLNFNIDQRPSNLLFSWRIDIIDSALSGSIAGTRCSCTATLRSSPGSRAVSPIRVIGSMGSPSRRQGCTTALENIGYMRWWEEITLIINKNNVSAGSFAHRGKPADCVGVCPGFDLGDKLFSI